MYISCFYPTFHMQVVLSSALSMYFSQFRSIMAVARMYIQDRSGLTANLNDYSLYSDLSDDELMQLAIERSLTENRILASAVQRQHAVQNQPNRRVRLNSETKYSYYFDTNSPPPDYEPENNAMLIPSSANPGPSLPL